MGTLAIMGDSIIGDILVFITIDQASPSDRSPIISAISDISAVTRTTGDICIGVGLAITEGFIHDITTFGISIGKRGPGRGNSIFQNRNKAVWTSTGTRSSRVLGTSTG